MVYLRATTFAAIVTLVLVGCAAQPAFADDLVLRPGPFVQLQGGFAMSEATLGGGGTIRLGRRVNRWASIELLADVRPEVRGAMMLGARVFAQHSRLQPWAGVHAGTLISMARPKPGGVMPVALGFRFAGGATYHLSECWALTAEVTWYQGATSSAIHTLSGGLGTSLGVEVSY